jgi:hypothetical protein
MKIKYQYTSCSSAGSFGVPRGVTECLEITNPNGVDVLELLEALSHNSKIGTITNFTFDVLEN